AGHEASVVFLGMDRPEGGHPFADALGRFGVEVDFVSRSRFPYGGERAGLESVLSRRRVAVLNTHGSRPAILAGSVARRLKVPLVSTVHGITVLGFKSQLMHRAEWRALRRFDAVIAVSRPLVDDLSAKGIPRNRLAFVPNAFAPGTPLLARD